MIVGDISLSNITQLLKTQGVSVQSGPFTFNVKSSVKNFAYPFSLMYKNHPIVESGAFIDFYTSVDNPGLIRSLIRPQIRFYFDGSAPFYPLPEDQAFAAFEWGLNWVTSNHAHQYLMLHAAVIEKNGHSLILPGEPGSGKSTLCTYLVHKGWRLLSDELTMINLSTREVVPLCRPISLKNQSIEVIQNLLDNVVLGPVVAGTSKGVVTHAMPPIDSVQKMDSSAPVAWIIFPKYKAGSDTIITPKPKAESFLELGKNAFNYSFHSLNGMQTMKSIVSSAGVYDLQYSDLESAQNTIDNLKPAEPVTAEVMTYSREK